MAGHIVQTAGEPPRGGDHMVKINKARPFKKYEELGAYHWDWYESNYGKYRELVDLALKYIPNERKSTILDVGCGDGLTSFRLYQKGLRVLGIDTNPVAIKYAEEVTEKARWQQPSLLRFAEKLGINLKKLLKYRQDDLRFQVQSIYDLNPEEQFDYVLCHDVIEHVQHPEKLIERVHAATKKFAIISTPNAKTKSPRKYDYFMWLPDEFLGLFGDRKVELVYCDDKKIYAKMYKS